MLRRRITMSFARTLTLTCITTLTLLTNVYATTPPDAVIDEFAMQDADIERLNDHPGSPDGDRATFFTDESYITLSFSTPTRQPSQGLNQQAFLVRVKNSTIPPNPSSSPSLTAELWEDGELVEVLDTIVPGPTASDSLMGEVLVYTWSASSLSSVDGSEVELKLIQDQPAGLLVILLDSISWEEAGAVVIEYGGEDGTRVCQDRLCY